MDTNLNHKFLALWCFGNYVFSSNHTLSFEFWSCSQGNDLSWILAAAASSDSSQLCNQEGRCQSYVLLCILEVLNAFSMFSADHGLSGGSPIASQTASVYPLDFKCETTNISAYDILDLVMLGVRSKFQGVVVLSVCVLLLSRRIILLCFVYFLMSESHIFTYFFQFYND